MGLPDVVGLEGASAAGMAARVGARADGGAAEVVREMAVGTVDVV